MGYKQQILQYEGSQVCDWAVADAWDIVNAEGERRDTAWEVHSQSED